MKHRNIPKMLLSLFVFVFINSCTASVALVEQYKQVEIISYHAPEDLNGDAQNAGLLLIDAVRKDALLPPWALTGVTIASLNEPDKKISTGSFKTGGFFGRNSGIVIIHSLAPGFYNIIEITVVWESPEGDVRYDVYMPMGNIAIEVKANTPAYYGQIQIQMPWGSTSREIKLNYVKKREIESWKMVSNKYNDSSWVTIIDEHIKNLE
jgi:hypothetical protein